MEKFLLYNVCVSCVEIDEEGCPFKEKCIKGNNCKTPMEERSKVLYVSKTKEEKRAQNLSRIPMISGLKKREIQSKTWVLTQKRGVAFAD